MGAAMRRLFPFVVALFFLSNPLRACQPESRTPKVGLALSGGGARGAAHIGVLKALEREGIPVDYIAGTSFGALVGGLYALGYSPEKIEQIFSSQNWDDLFSDSPDRRLSPLVQRKNFRYLGELRLRGFNVEIPAGLWGGQKLTELLNYYTTTKEILDAGFDFDRLRIPFRAVATDLLTGKPYVFRRGPMAEALRASIAIPMMFTPVEKENMLLVDGGLANNLPVDIVKEMGADIVIAVDVSSPLYKKEEIRTFFDVMDQSVSLLTRQSIQANLERADLVLRPDLQGFTYSSYTRVREIAARGEQAAMGMKESLCSIVGNNRSNASPAGLVQPAAPIIDSVAIEGPMRLDALQLKRAIKTRPGAPMDLDVVRADLRRLYATRLFEHVDYRLDPAAGNLYRLNYQVKESPANTLGASMRYDPDYEFVGLAEVNSSALFGTPSAAATFSSQFGGLDNHSANLHLVHSRIPIFFLEPMLQYRKLERLDLRDKVQVDKYADKRVGGQFMVGGTFFNRLEVSAGYRFDRVRISGGTSPNRQDDARDLAGLRLHIRRDTLDEQEFPHTGMFLDLLAENKSHAVGSDFSYSSLQADLQRSFPLSGKSTIRLRLGATVSRGQVPFYDRAYIGGYNFSELASRHFFGLKRDELVARQAGLGAASYHREIFSKPLSFVRRGFLLLEYDVAALSDKDSQPYDFKVFHGAGAGLSLDTLLGPMRFAAGLAERGRGRFYLSLGPSF